MFHETLPVIELQRTFFGGMSLASFVALSLLVGFKFIDVASSFAAATEDFTANSS